MKYFSMFSGIGGFEYAIERETDWECIGYSEIDQAAIKVYEREYNHKGFGDATKINEKELPDFDLLIGGFPCQAFSVAGNRKGFEDTRGTLFFDIARIAREKQPQFLLLENVKGLLSHDNGNTFTTILSVLDELGYDVEWQVLNSKNFGMVQNRERVFIIGHNRKGSIEPIFPIEGTSKTAIRPYVQTSGIGSWVFPTLYTKTHRGDAAYIYESDRIRTLTPIECERLMGFPDDYTKGLSVAQRIRCLGNAVCTLVVSAIITKINNNHTEEINEFEGFFE